MHSEIDGWMKACGLGAKRLDWGMITMVRSADLVAYVAHSAVGQTRKYTGEPYINHPRAVADIVRRRAADCDAHTVCLALLHDVVEDTKMTLDDMEHLFGRRMRADLEFLTKSDVSAGARTERLALDIARLGKAPPHVQTVKVADIIDNTGTIAERDPDYARRYLPEKKAMLEVLTAADAGLLKSALEQIEAAEAKLALE